MPKASLDLTGQWQFKQFPLDARRMRDLDSADWLDCTVPNSVFENLIQADQLDRSELTANPENFTSVSEKPWVYKKTFELTPDILDAERCDLIFDGLDTIASIWLNDKLIARTLNMFIAHRFDVTSQLKTGTNTLLVKFDPAAAHAAGLMHRYGPFTKADFQNPQRAYIRKAQYQFGWDFCPALPGCGIFQPVRIEAFDTARIADINIRTVDCDPLAADIKIQTRIENFSNKPLTCDLTISRGDQKINHTMTFTHHRHHQSAVIRIDVPALWFPAAYGDQPLYDLDVELLSDEKTIDRTQKKFGIRNLKLNRHPDENGQNFRFEINDQPIFAKGTNWLPPSILQGAATDDDYRRLLTAVADANINMLRVWGGGIYESELFYELCDQLGIMVWQDFMFACAYYPDRKWFTEQIESEAQAVITRIRNHPSLVLFCGNNEIDQMHQAGQLGKGKKFYGKAIYHKLLPQLVSELAPDTPYVPTTPQTKKTKSKTHRPQTVHRWDVWSDHQSVSEFVRPDAKLPRFVTEFGLQSMPDIQTVKNFSPQKAPAVASYQVEKHNYQTDGNSRLHRYIADLFGPASDIAQFIYLSQLTQARAARTFVEHLRAHNHINNGVLFWQFNDPAPAITWSAIDHNKNKKALYYYTRRFFADQTAILTPDPQQLYSDRPQPAQQLNAIVLNDCPTPLTATLNCQLTDLAGNLIDKTAFAISAAPFTNSTPLKLPKQICCPENPQNSALELFIADSQGKKLSRNLYFYLPDKYLEYPLIKIEKNLTKISDTTWKLTLNSNAIAPDVQITAPQAANLSDNFIDLIPNGQTEITIDYEKPITTEQPPINLRSFRFFS